ncbi:hypothetical protein EOL73_04335 [Candidatus Saccharibacteria bacterium]|nr:hypothetical protein [Candidatus Saccharibacteria bacterium]
MVKNLLDLASDEDKKKILEHNASESLVPVEPEDLLLAEFALKFGWEAYKAVKNDEIGSAEMKTLIAASRKIDLVDLYRHAQASLIGAGSANSKKPSSTFKSMTKNIIKGSQADA